MKVRSEVKVRLAAGLAQIQAGGQSPVAALALAQEIRALAQSGLAEDDDQASGNDAAQALVFSATQALTAVAVPDQARLEPFEQALVETELLRQGRFGAFRAMRARAESAPGVTRGAGHD